MNKLATQRGVAAALLTFALIGCGGKQAPPMPEPNPWQQTFPEADCSFRAEPKAATDAHVFFTGWSGPSASMGTARSKADLSSVGQFSAFVQNIFEGGMTEALEETVAEDDMRLVGVFKAYRAAMSQQTIAGGKVEKFCDLERPFLPPTIPGSIETASSGRPRTEYACFVLYSIPKATLNPILDSALDSAIADARDKKLFKAKRQAEAAGEEIRAKIQAAIERGGIAGTN